MSRRYTTADLMAAIVDLKEATAHGLTSVRTDLTAEMERRFNAFRTEFKAEMKAGFELQDYKMNKRFDSVDLRFDVFERRVQALERKRA